MEGKILLAPHFAFFLGKNLCQQSSPTRDVLSQAAPVAVGGEELSCVSAPHASVRQGLPHSPSAPPPSLRSLEINVPKGNQLQAVPKEQP